MVALDTLLFLKVDGASLSTLPNQQTLEQALTTAKDWLDQALDGLRAAGTEHHLPRGLLARASYHRYALTLALPASLASTQTATATTLPPAPQAAIQDLQKAHDIAQRGGMRLHLTDYHLESARLALTYNQDIHEQSAEQHLSQARGLIAATGYNRRLPELEYLQEFASHPVGVW